VSLVWATVRMYWHDAVYHATSAILERLLTLNHSAIVQAVLMAHRAEAVANRMDKIAPDTEPVTQSKSPHRMEMDAALKQRRMAFLFLVFGGLALALLLLYARRH
jgi:hypothetical protein